MTLSRQRVQGKYSYTLTHGATLTMHCAACSAIKTVFEVPTDRAEHVFSGWQAIHNKTCGKAK